MCPHNDDKSPPDLSVPKCLRRACPEVAAATPPGRLVMCSQPNWSMCRRGCRPTRPGLSGVKLPSPGVRQSWAIAPTAEPATAAYTAGTLEADALAAAPSPAGAICPSDWDKRKTSAVSRSNTTTCGGRQKAKRRGQDSNLRTNLSPVNGLANRRFRPLSHLS